MSLATNRKVGRAALSAPGDAPEKVNVGWQVLRGAVRTPRPTFSTRQVPSRISLIRGRNWLRIVCLAFVCAFAFATNAQEQSKFPCPENEVARYTAHHVKKPIRIDGKLDEPAWQRAPRSPRFSDIISGKPAIHDTRASVLWDEEHLYVAYRIEEPLVHAKYTNHNDPIYYDNDVELFIAGRDAYYEFEINAFNTSYEVFFIWSDAYEKSGFASATEFQRTKLKPFNGVGFKTHPRGGRLGNFDWSFPGKKPLSRSMAR